MDSAPMFVRKLREKRLSNLSSAFEIHVTSTKRCFGSVETDGK